MSKIPEEIKQIKPYPFHGYAPGNYRNKCWLCEDVMISVDKLCFVCLECAIKLSVYEARESKSEISTLEQTIIDQDAQILEIRKELERVKAVVYYTNKSWHCAFYRATSEMTAREIHDFWLENLNEFKTKHNL